METILLQRIGPVCVAAHNAWQMCLMLPNVTFLAMEARHCAGAEIAGHDGLRLLGRQRSGETEGAAGFIGNANDGTAHWFGAARGFGTMPHSLIGYAGSTLRAAEMFHETFPAEPMTVLADYFGREISDALAVCARFPDWRSRAVCRSGWIPMAAAPGGARSGDELCRPGASRPGCDPPYRDDAELRFLIGTGVSAAAIWRMRKALNEAGYKRARIVASSGFGAAKCRVMADARAPIDVIGTGSFIPDSWHETYATADIVEYDGRPM